MKRVLITGMSGSGKSRVIEELIARGYRAHDLDTAEWSEWVEAEGADELTPARAKDWVGREARVHRLLTEPIGETLFVSGCASNMHHFLSLLDVVILLSAPVATIMERLAERPVGSYGHTPEERGKIAVLISTVEPLLRKSADYEVDTTKPVSAAVDEILRLTPTATCHSPGQ